MPTKIILTCPNCGKEFNPTSSMRKKKTPVILCSADCIRGYWNTKAQKLLAEGQALVSIHEEFVFCHLCEKSIGTVVGTHFHHVHGSPTHRYDSKLERLYNYGLPMGTRLMSHKTYRELKAKALVDGRGAYLTNRKCGATKQSPKIKDLWRKVTTSEAQKKVFNGMMLSQSGAKARHIKACRTSICANPSCKKEFFHLACQKKKVCSVSCQSALFRITSSTPEFKEKQRQGIDRAVLAGRYLKKLLDNTSKVQ